MLENRRGSTAHSHTHTAQNTSEITHSNPFLRVRDQSENAATSLRASCIYLVCRVKIIDQKSTCISYKKLNVLVHYYLITLNLIRKQILLFGRCVTHTSNVIFNIISDVRKYFSSYNCSTSETRGRTHHRAKGSRINHRHTFARPGTVFV